MFGHNRFDEQDKTKLGKLFKSTFDVPCNIQSDIENAVPIWDLLGLTFIEYNEKYKTDDIKEEVKAEEVVVEEDKDDDEEENEEDEEEKEDDEEDE